MERAHLARAVSFEFCLAGLRMHRQRIASADAMVALSPFPTCLASDPIQCFGC